ncbi:MAG: SsrA-binding protein SmpB [Deltaproteobacteria bacterium]|nr:SsrA-binding protein SmpB [Deltaproteobacteria bacterium]
MAENIKIIADNRKARFEYELSDKVEAGIALTGTEVKSLRQGKLNLGDAYCQVDKGEMWLVDAHISPYAMGNRFNVEPLRRRKLLMHKLEILKMHQKVKERGLTLIPTKVYFKHGRVKVEVALAKGKKLHDKSQAIKSRDLDRDARREAKER